MPVSAPGSITLFSFCGIIGILAMTFFLWMCYYRCTHGNDYEDHGPRVRETNRRRNSAMVHPDNSEQRRIRLNNLPSNAQNSRSSVEVQSSYPQPPSTTSEQRQIQLNALFGNRQTLQSPEDVQSNYPQPSSMPSELEADLAANQDSDIIYNPAVTRFSTRQEIVDSDAPPRYETSIHLSDLPPPSYEDLFDPTDKAETRL